MKNIIRICMVFMLAMSLSSCAASYRKMEIRSASLKDVSLTGNPITATVEVSVYNPSAKLELSEVSGTLRVGEQQIVNFTTEPVTLPRRSVSQIVIPVQASIAPGIGIFQLLRLAQTLDISQTSIDASATVKNWLGIRKKKEIKDFKPAEALNKSKK